VAQNRATAHSIGVRRNWRLAVVEVAGGAVGFKGCELYVWDT
jgi:hypothetical protein